MTEYITVKLTKDQIEDIDFTYHKMFYEYMTTDNQYAHFCHRINKALWKAKDLANAKS